MVATILLGPLFVSHYPYTYGDSTHEEPWKESVASECKNYWKDKQLLERPVNLKLKFFLRKDKDYDLTGILESTVNAISSVIFPPHRGGYKTRWNHEVRCVYSVEASKEFRSSEA